MRANIVKPCFMATETGEVDRDRDILNLSFRSWGIIIIIIIATVPSLKMPRNQWMHRRKAAVRRQSGSAHKGGVSGSSILPAHSPYALVHPDTKGPGHG